MMRMRRARGAAGVSITGNSGGNFENVATAGTVLTSVTDDADSSTVTLSTTAPASVAEGATITYTATVDNAVTGTDLVLTLSNGQTITIAVGQTTGSVDYAVRADDAYAQGTAGAAWGVDHGQQGWELRERGDDGDGADECDR